MQHIPPSLVDWSDLGNEPCLGLVEVDPVMVLGWGWWRAQRLLRLAAFGWCISSPVPAGHRSPPPRPGALPQRRRTAPAMGCSFCVLVSSVRLPVGGWLLLWDQGELHSLPTRIVLLVLLKKIHFDVYTI